MSYLPIFEGVFSGSADFRWKKILVFLRQWRAVDVSINNVSDRNKSSVSLRYWDELCDYYCEHGEPELRDCPTWAPFGNFMSLDETRSATVILEQGEGDVFWAVPNDCLDHDDPPVDIYQTFDDSMEACLGRVPTVSQFALCHLLIYNDFAKVNKKWFYVEASNEDILHGFEWFDFSLDFRSGDNYTPQVTLFESVDIAGILKGNRLSISVFRDPCDLELPEFNANSMS